MIFVSFCYTMAVMRIWIKYGGWSSKVTIFAPKS